MQRTIPIWLDTVSNSSQYPSLHGRVEVDVAIVGAGLTGITAAYCLKRAGKRVAVIEQNQVGAGETGHTTAHITASVDSRYYHIAEKFGRKAATLVYESNHAAIQFIADQVAAHPIDCDFSYVPAYLYATDRKQVRELREEFYMTQRIGFMGAWLDKPKIPYNTEAVAAVRFPEQAQFHPLKYLKALARVVDGGGSFIFENSRVEDFTDGEPCIVKTAQGEIRAKKVIFATNTSIANRFAIHTKAAAYRTYAVSARLPRDFKLDGLYWDMEEPYHYIRMERHKQDGMLIVGGEDHKTGHSPSMKGDTNESFSKLEAYLRKTFPEAGEITNRWSGQVIEPVDALPYIGRAPFSKHFYMATGYSGNGMTFATVAGLMLTDEILGRGSLWADLYSPSRIKPLASAGEFIAENKDFPMCMIRDRVAGTEAGSLAEIPVGQGRVMKVEGKKVAVYKDAQGSVQCVSAVCTHMGCQVRFNQAETSWDCPCHGSRFSTDGQVLNGPAVQALAPVEVPGAQPVIKPAETEAA